MTLGRGRTALFPVQEAVELPQKLQLSRLRRPHAHPAQVVIPLVVHRHFSLAFPVGANDRKEGLLDVGPQLGARLDEATAQLLGQVVALERADLPPVVEVALVADQDHEARRKGEAVDGPPGLVELALGRQDLLEQPLGGLEAGPPRHVEDDDEELVLPYPLLPQRAVLLLAGRVEDLQVAGGAVDDALAPVAVFQRGVVRLGEDVLGELRSLVSLFLLFICHAPTTRERESSGWAGRDSKRERERESHGRTFTVNEVFPTPPSPSIAILSVILPAPGDIAIATRLPSISPDLVCFSLAANPDYLLSSCFYRGLVASAAGGGLR